MTEFPGRWYLLNGDDNNVALERNTANNVVLAASKFDLNGRPLSPSSTAWKYQAWEIPKTTYNFRGARRYHLLNYNALTQALELTGGAPTANTRVITRVLNLDQTSASYPDIPLGQTGVSSTIQKLGQLWLIEETGSPDTYHLINFQSGTYLDRNGTYAVGNAASNRSVQKWILKRVDEPSR